MERVSTQRGCAFVLFGLLSMACSPSPPNDDGPTGSGGMGIGGAAGHAGSAGAGAQPSNDGGAIDGDLADQGPIWGDRTLILDGMGGASSDASAGEGGALNGAFYPPNAELVYAGQGPSAGLAIVGATVSVENRSTDSVVHWLAAVKNSGPDPICSVGVNADMKGSNGDVLLSPRANVDGEAYANGATSLHCIGVGKIGVGHWLGNVAATVDPLAITRIEYGFPGTIVPTAMPANRVSISNVRVEPAFAGSDMSVVKGTASASQSAKILGVYVYPKNAAGRPLELVIATNLGTLAAGATWDFTTTATKESLTDYHFFLDYSFP